VNGYEKSLIYKEFGAASACNFLTEQKTKQENRDEELDNGIIGSLCYIIICG
jgi:hypothetical protein